MNNRDYIETLAFVGIFYRQSHGGIIPKNYSAKKYAAKFKCSRAKVKKAIAILTELNLLKPMGENVQILGVKECIKILLPNRKTNKHFRFIKYKNGIEYVLPLEAKLKDFTKLIEEELVRLNFTQQLDRQLKKPFNTNTSLKSDALDFKKDVSVTGSKHIAKQLGVSTSTGNRRLLKWNSDKKIERVIVSVEASEVIRINGRLANYAKQVPKAKKLNIGSAILNFSIMGSHYAGRQFIKRVTLEAKQSVKEIKETISSTAMLMWCSGRYC